MAIDELLCETITILSPYHISAVVVLGPDPYAGDDDRLLLAVSKPDLHGAGYALMESREFGAHWRMHDAPLVMVQSLDDTTRVKFPAWRSLWKQSGFESFVRIALPLVRGRMFEIYLLAKSELTLSDAAAVNWSTQMLWPTIKRAIVKAQITLTNREIEVLSLALQAMSTDEIGELLGCAERTAQFHMQNAMKKLKTDNKLVAMQRANWMGLF